jgi:diguanylate cyclase (GGDEF)-like protein
MQSSGLTAECLQVLRTGLASQREVPLTTKDGRMLWLQAHLVPFDRDGQRHLLAHFIDLTEHHRTTQELKQMAFHDSLTGLANRRLLWDHFVRTQPLRVRHQEWGAVLLLDLNQFKQLNDRYGHNAGDVVLQTVARRLQHSVRASDVIARLGGDEFALLVQGDWSNEAQAKEHVQRLCDKLLRSLSTPCSLSEAGHAVAYRASASIGFALIDPQGRNDLDTLLRCADTRMYQHKRACMAAAGHTQPAMVA